MDGAGGDAGVEPPELDKEEALTEMMGNKRRKSSGSKALSPWEASGRAQCGSLEQIGHGRVGVTNVWQNRGSGLRRGSRTEAGRR